MKISLNQMLLLAATTLVTACVNGQPPPQCAVGHGGFAAKFTHTGGPNTGPCYRLGDIVGVQKYRQADNTSDVYLKSVWLADEDYNSNFPLGGDAAGLANGKLAANAPVDNFCSVPTLTTATGVDPNGETLTYTWSNVRFYMTGAVPGTQFTADLSITGPNCTAASTYRVDALYPVIFCSDYTEGDPRAPPNYQPPVTLNTPNIEHCHEADHVWSHLTANPTFNMACEPTRFAADTDTCSSGSLWATFVANRPGYNCGQTHLCVPATTIPSLVDDSAN